MSGSGRMRIPFMIRQIGGQERGCLRRSVRIQEFAGRQGRAGSADVPRVGAGERVRVERRQAVGVALPAPRGAPVDRFADLPAAGGLHGAIRSEEHTSELQSLMRISYAVFCLKKKK